VHFQSADPQLSDEFSHKTVPLYALTTYRKSESSASFFSIFSRSVRNLATRFRALRIERAETLIATQRVRECSNRVVKRRHVGGVRVARDSVECRFGGDRKIAKVPMPALAFVRLDQRQFPACETGAQLLLAVLEPLTRGKKRVHRWNDFRVKRLGAGPMVVGIVLRA
jgi:hypothetical protein